MVDNLENFTKGVKVKWGDGAWCLKMLSPFDSHGGLNCEPVNLLEHDSTIDFQKYYETW